MNSSSYSRYFLYLIFIVTVFVPHWQDLQKFIDEAEAGVIIFSLGSIINASSMSVKTRTAFVNAFAVIPQRVIWKFEEPIEGISSNVFLSSWIPQRDILGKYM